MKDITELPPNFKISQILENIIELCPHSAIIKLLSWFNFSFIF